MKFHVFIAAIFYITLTLLEYAHCAPLELDSILKAGEPSLMGPGLGWDYLEDAARSAVQKYDSFTQNKYTDDGYYRIPDCMTAESVKTSSYIDDAQIVNVYSKYTSSKSKSLTIGATLSYGNFSIAAGYSSEYYEMQSEQKNTSTVTGRAMYIDHRYNLIGNTRCPLDSSFMMVASDLLTALEYEDAESAEYFAQEIVGDYGTHFIKRAKLGGKFYSDEYIRESYWESMQESQSSVGFAVSLNFATVNGIGFNKTSNLSSAQYNQYASSVTRTYIKAIGGEYQAGQSAAEWSKTLKNNLVPLDREADMINAVFAASNFPGFTYPVVKKANEYVLSAIKEYLSSNVITGCPDVSSINYDEWTNQKSGFDCAEKVRFGGVITTTKQCTHLNINGVCAQLTNQCVENNLITNSRACPAGYIQKVSFSTDTFEVIECVGDDSVTHGAVLFGGMYSALFDNPVTKDKSCPPMFFKQSLFDCSNNVICVSKDANNLSAIRYAVPFGGIYSNCNASPLQTDCSLGLDSHLINIINGCQIYVCAKFKHFGPPKLKKMPFVAKPPTYNVIKALNKHRK